MDIELKSNINLFKDTYKDVKNNFLFDGQTLNALEALFIINKNEFNVKKVKEIRKFIISLKIKDIASRRGFLKLISLFICDYKDYKNILKSSNNIYDHLLAKGFLKGKQTYIIAILLAKNFNEDKLSESVRRVIELKEAFNSINYEYYIILMLSGKSVREIESDLEITKNEIMNIDNFNKDKRELLALSLIMSKKDIRLRLENVFELICNIKSELGKVSSRNIFLIGLISLIVEESEVFSKELKNTYMLLNENRRFKYFMNKDKKVTISLNILISKYIEEAKAEIIDSQIRSDYLNIIQDYLIYLMYDN